MDAFDNSTAGVDAGCREHCQAALFCATCISMESSTPLVTLPPWQGLSLREQVSQLVVFHLSHDIARSPDVAAYLREYPVGAVFAGGEVIEDGTNCFESVRALVERCQAASRVPLLVGADLENGCGDVLPGLTPLPWPMALGAANDPDLAYRYGEVTALEGLRAGINWALAPMADLNLHPLSSNVGTRAFGDRAEHVLPLLKAFCRGLRAHGMADCAKTFPGDGSDYRDQHLTTTLNQLGRTDWEASYGRVFQGLIDDGAESVMIAHIGLPAFQERNAQGGYDPATLSREIITGLLKERMGFEGLVLSDAFGMGGLLSHGDLTECAVEAFACGMDMVLWPGEQFVDRVIGELRAGRIPMSRLEDALNRIWRMKALYATSAMKPGEEATERAEAVAAETAAKSLTLLWNRDEALPLKPERDHRILLLGVTPYEKAYARLQILRDELAGRGFAVEAHQHLTPEELAAMEGDFDRILVCVERQFHRPLGPMDLFGEDARNVWSCSCAGWHKMVAVGFGSPYLVPWYFPQVPAAVNAYSAVSATQAAVAAALCGEAGFPGKTPVAYENRFGVRNLRDWGL